MDGSNILRAIQELTLLAPGFLLAITVHEFTHGYVAYKLGDPTAKLMGRLTFNPISHLDLFGTLALVLTGMIGWAKPVPVDARYLKNPRRDLLWISLGGPAANLVAAVAVAILLHLIIWPFQGKPVGEIGSYVLGPLGLIMSRAVVINVGLAVFNLLPVPPLDGFSVLMGLLPRNLAYKLHSIEPYGFIILIGLIVTGAVGFVLRPVILFLVKLLVLGLG